MKRSAKVTETWWCKMEFCPKCGMKLTPTRKKKGKKDTIVLSCPKCRYKKRAAGPVTAVSKTIEHSPQELIAVIGKEEQKLRTMPTVKIECPKCGNNLAYVWQVQTRGSFNTVFPMHQM